MTVSAAVEEDAGIVGVLIHLVIRDENREKNDTII